MVHSDNIVRFTAADWLERIRPRLLENGSLDSGHTKILSLTWSGLFEREGAALFATAEDAMWFVLKYT